MSSVVVAEGRILVHLYGLNEMFLGYERPGVVAIPCQKDK